MRASLIRARLSQVRARFSWLRPLSSAGSERVPSKHQVAGSSPAGVTKTLMVINILRDCSRKQIQGPHPKWKGLLRLIPVLQKMIPAREPSGPSASTGIRFPADPCRAKRMGICVPGAFSGHKGNQVRKRLSAPFPPENSSCSRKNSPLIPLHESEWGSASRVPRPNCRRV